MLLQQIYYIYIHIGMVHKKLLLYEFLLYCNYINFICYKEAQQDLFLFLYFLQNI